MKNYYEKEYNDKLNTYPETFKITIAEFKKWLENNKDSYFMNAVKTEENIHYLASDYAIPVAMVKYFKNADALN